LLEPGNGIGNCNFMRSIDMPRDLTHTPLADIWRIPEY
jgi:hypothetical protein